MAEHLIDIKRVQKTIHIDPRLVARITQKGLAINAVIEASLAKFLGVEVSKSGKLRARRQ